MVLDTSMMPLKLSDFSSLICSASRMTHSPIEIRSARSCLRQVVLGLGEILDEDRPQLAHEQQRLDRLARLRAGLLGRLQQLDRAFDRLALALARALRGFVEHFCVGELVHALPFRRLSTATCGPVC